jgi:hypothetical protein
VELADVWGFGGSKHRHGRTGHPRISIFAKERQQYAKK